VLTNFDHDRQWFNTLIPPSHESAAVTVDCISCLSGPVKLALRYTTPDGGIKCNGRQVNAAHISNLHFREFSTSNVPKTHGSGKKRLRTLPTAYIFMTTVQMVIW